MSDELFGERRHALEEAFFRKQNDQAVQHLREKAHQDEALSAFAKAHGIHDPELVAQLDKAGVTPATLAAIWLVPLVEVAWADGVLEPKERAAILEAAKTMGVKPDSDSGALLATWLDHAPEPSLRDAWAVYVGQLIRTLDPAAARQLHDDTVGRARRIAQAAGGILGIGAISTAEQKVLEFLDVWTSA